MVTEQQVDWMLSEIKRLIMTYEPLQKPLTPEQWTMLTNDVINTVDIRARHDALMGKLALAIFHYVQEEEDKAWQKKS